MTERPATPRRADDAPPTEVGTEPTGRSRLAASRRGRRALVLAGCAYLALAVLIWWHVWTGDPSTTTTCACGDSSLFLWFLEWPAYALVHGHGLLYSKAMSYPGGVNLLANTSELAIGVVLAPITWVFGPVATLNVAVTLAPALSALAAYTLIRRYVDWVPAAFLGGLFYGFSPLILVSLTDAHLMVGMAPVPPLVALCLDELLVRQRWRAVATGLLLGALLVLQFFLGSELLVLTLIGAALGVVLLVAGAARRPGVIAAKTHHALVGLGVGATTTVVLLAYPVWFTLAGPAHTSGPVWPILYLGYEGAQLHQVLLPQPVSTNFQHFTARIGGYQGPTLSGEYLGFGVLAVAIAGLAIWRRDLRLWLFGGVAFGSGVLALGARPHVWLPWSVAAGLPELQNIIPTRFLIITTLALAVMIGLVADHARRAVRSGHRYRPAGPPTGLPPARRWLAAAVATGVTAVAIVPVAAYLAASTPNTTQPVVVPSWFRSVAPHLSGHQVLLVYPVPNQAIESAMAWQAIDRMSFTMVGGGGPGGVPQRAGKERPGLAVIGASSFTFAPQRLVPGAVGAARAALDGWGVTMVVIPDQHGLPLYDEVSSSPFAVGLMTAAIGRPPVRQDGAWVWSDVEHAGAAAQPAPAAFEACVAAATPPVGSPLSAPPDTTSTSATAGVARCVLHAAPTSR
ncbi:MAG: hypothetical protein ACYCVN_07835 [Acidimicrobiales bacterium]